MRRAADGRVVEVELIPLAPAAEAQGLLAAASAGQDQGLVLPSVRFKGRSVIKLAREAVDCFLERHGGTREGLARVARWWWGMWPTGGGRVADGEGLDYDLRRAIRWVLPA